MGGAATDITRIQATYHDQSTKNHAPTPGVWSYESNTVGIGSTFPQKQIPDILGTSICIRLGGTSIPDLLQLSPGRVGRVSILYSNSWPARARAVCFSVRSIWYGTAPGGSRFSDK